MDRQVDYSTVSEWTQEEVDAHQREIDASFESLWTCVDCGQKTPQFHRCKECAGSPRHFERFGGEVPAGVDW